MTVTVARSQSSRVRSTTVNSPSSHLSRRNFLSGVAAIAAGACLSACGKPGTDTTAGAVDGSSPLAVGLLWLKNIEYAGNYLAEENGFYRAEHIGVTHREGGPNAPAPQISIASREVGIAYEVNTDRLFQSLAKGQDLVLVAAQYQTPTSGLLSLKKRPVLNPADLRGLRVLAAERARTTIESVMTVNGQGDYEFVPAGNSVDPLLANQGDVLLAHRMNQPVVLEKKFGLKEGKDYFFTGLNELGYDTYGELLFTDRRALSENRQQLVGFLRATIKGWELNRRDPRRGAELTVAKYGKHLGLDLASESRANEIQIPLLESPLTRAHGLFRIDTERLAGPVYESLKASGLAKLPEPRQVVDTTVLDEVYAGRTSLLD